MSVVVQQHWPGQSYQSFEGHLCRSSENEDEAIMYLDAVMEVDRGAQSTHEIDSRSRDVPRLRIHLGWCNNTRTHAALEKRDVATSNIEKGSLENTRLVNHPPVSLVFSKP